MGTSNFDNPLGIEKVYARAEEKFLKTTIIYADIGGSDYVYWDRDLENAICRDDLLNLFMKGVCVFNVRTGLMFKPTTCWNAATEEYVTIGTVTTLNGGAPMLYSSEYPGNPV